MNTFIKEQPTGPRWVGVRKKSGQATADLARSDDFQPYVSRRFVELLEGVAATGWSTVTAGNTLVMNGATGHRLLISGRSGGERLQHDLHVRESELVPGSWVAETSCFDPIGRGWDGSDVFHPEGTLHLVVTGRVHDALLAGGAHLTCTDIGRDPVMLVVADMDAETRWRRRTGYQQGSRAGAAECPDLHGPAQAGTSQALADE